MAAGPGRQNAVEHVDPARHRPDNIGRLADAHTEHGRIVDEIEARRPRRAAEAMTGHIRYAELYLKRLEKEQPDFFV